MLCRLCHGLSNAGHHTQRWLLCHPSGHVHSLWRLLCHMPSGCRADGKRKRLGYERMIRLCAKSFLLFYQCWNETLVINEYVVECFLDSSLRGCVTNVWLLSLCDEAFSKINLTNSGKTIIIFNCKKSNYNIDLMRIIIQGCAEMRKARFTRKN